MGLVAACRITGVTIGANMVSTINQRLKQVTVTDLSGIESDSARIEIAAAGLVDWPSTGGKLRVSMGYQGNMVALGDYQVMSIADSLDPDVIVLTCAAAPLAADDLGGFRDKRSRTWADTTIGAMVEEVAALHGFVPRVHSGLSRKAVVHYDQNDQSDVGMLTQIARSYDALCKVIDGKLVFGRRGQLKNLSGRTMTPVNVVYAPSVGNGGDSYITGSVSSSDHDRYNGVRTRWLNEATGEHEDVFVGDKPYRHLREIHDSKIGAEQIANAELVRLGRELDRLTLALPGNGQLAAETVLRCSGFPRARYNGDWSCDRVTHTYSGGGYRSSLTATRPAAG